MEAIVYFRYIPDEPQFQISFEYSITSNGLKRKFNFNRNVTESVQTCMGRIKNNLEKSDLKKKKDTSEKIKISIQLFNNEELLSEQTFKEILSNTEKLNLTLYINDEAFKVIVNLPFVSELSLPSTILSGFLVHPHKLFLQFSSIDECDFIWYRGSIKNDDETRIWEEIGQGYCYLTTTRDINYNLKVKCIPRNENDIGASSECISQCLVRAGPSFCPFEKRHDLTKVKLKDNKFRIMSYNLLADYYSKTEISKRIFYPYCVSHALEIDYRKQLFIKEIIGYNSDIICLQEVDENIFEFDLKPILGIKCMKGNFRKKGTTTEGLATFYDTRRFEIIEETGIHIGSNIKTLKIFIKLFKKIQKNTKLMDRITERSTTLQVTALRSKDNSDKILIVANTHLYFYPDADHIRLLQIGFSMLFIKDFIKKLAEKMPLNQIDFVFCGDFNSLPNNGIFKLLTEKTISKSCTDWKSSKFNKLLIFLTNVI